MWTDKNYVLRNSNGWVLQNLSMEFRDDIDIVKDAVSKWCYALEYASLRLRDNYSVVMVSVRNSGLSLSAASTVLQDNYEIVKAAVSENGAALKYASDTLRDDISIVKIAVSTYPALKYASDTLRRNREVSLTAIKSFGSAYRHTLVEKTTDFILDAIRANPLIYQYLDGEGQILRVSNKDIIIAILTNDALTLKYVPLHDKDIALFAVRQNCKAFIYVSEDLKGDMEIQQFVIMEEHNASISQKNKKLIRDIVYDTFFAFT